MKLEFPIVPANKPTLESRDLPVVPAFARSADAKETAIVCLSAALGFLFLQLVFVHPFAHCRKCLCLTARFFVWKVTAHSDRILAQL
jgi:hypothetical protein